MASLQQKQMLKFTLYSLYGWWSWKLLLETGFTQQPVGMHFTFTLDVNLTAVLQLETPHFIKLFLRRL